MKNGIKSGTKRATTGKISPFLGILLVVTTLLALFFLASGIQPLPEITGLLFFSLLFWIITEKAGWKADPLKGPEITGIHTAAPQVQGDAAAVTKGLPDSCAAFQGIDTDYGRIDYILVSRENGLFVVECKQHPGHVTLSGSRLTINNTEPEQDFFVKILWYAFWLREKVKATTGLDAVITPMIVFPNASVDVSEPVNNVIITDSKNILKNIQKTIIDPRTASELWKIYESGAVMW